MSISRREVRGYLFECKRQMEVFEVEEILDQAVFETVPHYLIKWKNYAHDWDTWEPIYRLEPIQEYLQFWIINKKPEIKRRLAVKPQPKKKIGPNKSCQKKMWEKYKPKTKRQREVIDLDAMEEEIAGKMPAQSFCPPEPIQQEPVSQSANQTETFKVVATLSTEYMSEIVGSFNWHGVPCLRVQLKNGDVVNMQEEDVRKEHPEMLIDYYEANNIKF